MNIDELNAEIETCNACGLCKGENKPVPGRGIPTALVMIVGEAPGKTEAERRKPFVGPSGQFLDTAIILSRLDMYSIWFTNTVKCRPTTGTFNRAPKSDEIVKCIGFLRQEIDLIKPRIIIPLGNTAFKNLNDYRKAISKARGKSYRTREDLVLFPTYHPAASMRDRSLRKIIIGDLVNAREFLDRRY